MSKTGRLKTILPIAAQLILPIGGLLVLTLAPPASGQMILVPTTAAAARDLPSLALNGDALLIAAGPLPGSLVVSGNRGAIAWRMLANGILTLRASPVGCTGTGAASVPEASA